VKAPDCSGNAAEVEPAATVTEVGAVSRLLTVESATFAPGASAGLLSVTRHEVVLEGPSVAGLHASVETRTGATRLMVVFVDALL